MAGSDTKNVTKLNFASEQMQAAEVLQCQSSFRSPPSRLLHQMLTQMRCRTVAILLVDSQSLCSYSVKQIILLRKY